MRVIDLLGDDVGYWDSSDQVTAYTEMIHMSKEIDIWAAKKQLLVEKMETLLRERSIVDADRIRIDWQQSNPSCEIKMEYDDDRDRLEWVVYRIVGSVNDREWHEIARGTDLRDAIDKAMKCKLK